MYLKEIIINGFKSFGRPTRIFFNKGITGIIGPNGSGKSNINDAIKWVLGETSKKTLRSKNNNDFIFEGSQTSEKCDMAYVKIVFDNSDRKLNINYNEVEISRRIYRDLPDNEYTLNGDTVRLKDIRHLITGTGLGKSSITNISQGSISSFIESKPDERRLLFEEAAGVSRYKYQKNDALNNLEKTRQNLKQIQIIIAEKEKRLPYLKKQAEKAEQYQLVKNKLDKIEVVFYANKINIIKNDLTKYNKKRIELENSIAEYLSKQSKSSNEIVLLSQKLNRIENERYNLEEEKIKIEHELSEYNQIINNKTVTNNKEDAKKFEILCSSNLEEIRIKKAELNTIGDKVKYISNDIDKLNTEYTNAERHLSMIERKISICENNLLHLQEQEKSYKYKNKANKYLLDNIKNFSGILGSVEDVIKIDKKYLTALYESSSNILDNIITKNFESTKKIVQYLEKNEIGYCTFVPIEDLDNPLYINSQYLIALKSQPEFIAILSDLIETSENYKKVIDYYFSRIIISQNIDTSIAISKFIDKKYKVVSLNGDIIYPGGVISGGYKNKKNNKNKFYFVEKNQELVNEKKILTEEREKIKFNKDSLYEKIMIENENLKNSENYIYKVKNDIETLETKYKYNSQSFKNITGKLFVIEDSKIEEKFKNIGSLKINLDKVVFDIRNVADKINKLNNSKNDLLLLQEQEKASEIYSNNELNIISRNITECNISIENYVKILTQRYNMSEEYCLKNYLKDIGNIDDVEKEVENLNVELKAIGTVDLESINIYKSENLEYQELLENTKDIVESENKILKAINEIDSIVVERFTNLIDSVNEHLPKIFKDLFEDGSAEIVYTEPENILETGIEIIARPPGKKISNLNLLSGGEKALVTLCVLFSILKVNPIPLSVLDEAEAALDVANVVRFANYMKNFTSTTQFIVITHRPGTMENCEKLYGATMQEKGITDVLSINIHEVQNYSNNSKENQNVI